MSEDGVKRPIPLAVASLIVGLVGVFLAAASNNDPWIDPVQRALPWTRGSCAIWSGAAWLAAFAIAVLGLSAAVHARRRAAEWLPLATLSVAVNLAVVAYWLVAAIGNFAVSCISDEIAEAMHMAARVSTGAARVS